MTFGQRRERLAARARARLFVIGVLRAKDTVLREFPSAGESRREKRDRRHERS